ncbi:MAG: alpha/beta hydrolase [Bacillota bacterium]|nr:alpha/beta hydrolase [Bacillota bacterium]
MIKLQSSQFKMSSADGTKLFVRRWQPNEKLTGVICLVHGLGEHSGRYHHVAEAIARAGYGVLAIDLRGHGQSAGKRGYTPSYDALMQDVDCLRAAAAKEFPTCPCYLYGHSMGGNLVLNYALRYKKELAGVIATSPWLKLSFEPSSIKLLVGHIMDKIYPGFIQENGLNAKFLSHDDEAVVKYLNDPLVHNKISARLFISVHAAGQWAIDNAKALELPVLLLHGAGDKITDVAGSNLFAQQARNCTFKVWSHLYHELHNEIEKEEVINTIIGWLVSKQK